MEQRKSADYGEIKMGFLSVFLGGGLGASLRWLVTSKIHYHWGTMVVNVLGALLIGALYGYISSKTTLRPEIKLFVMTGLLGGFTTFSTCLLDFAMLCEKDNFLEAATYLLLSVVVGLLVLFAGIRLSSFVFAA